MLDDVQHGHEVGHVILDREPAGVGLYQLRAAHGSARLERLPRELDRVRRVLHADGSRGTLLDRNGHELPSTGADVNDDLAGPEPAILKREQVGGGGFRTGRPLPWPVPGAASSEVMLVVCARRDLRLGEGNVLGGRRALGTHGGRGGVGTRACAKLPDVRRGVRRSN
jgi:hypothetical protein